MPKWVWFFIWQVIVRLGFLVKASFQFESSTEYLLFCKNADRIGDDYKIVSKDGMKTRLSKLDFAIQTGIQEAIGVDFGVDLV